MGTPVVDMREVPGGLFRMQHWQNIAVDLLNALMKQCRVPGECSWKSCVKPQTRQWAEEHIEYQDKERHRAKERALAKLTYDDKVALGLPV